MRPTREIEGRLAFQPKTHRATHGPHHAHDLVNLAILVVLLHRHEVHYLTNALVAEKTREEDVGVRQIHLPVLRLVHA